MEELQRQNAEQRDLLNALSEGGWFGLSLIFDAHQSDFRLESR